MRAKPIHRTNQFVITKRVRKGSGRVYYELSLAYNVWEKDWVERVRDIVDPTRNRAGRWGKSWKYQTRAAAERDLTMLLMQL